MLLRVILKQWALVILFFSVTGLHSQISQSLLKNELSVCGGPVFTTLLSENLKNDPTVFSNGSVQYNVGLQYSLFVSKYLRLVSGFALSQFKNTAHYKGAFLSAELKRDATGLYYNPYSAANYTDERRVKTIEIPFMIRMQTKEKNNYEFYAQAGLLVSLVYDYQITRSGSLSIMGSYPSIYKGITTISSNDPASGFVTTEFSGQAKDVEGNVFQFSAGASAGVRARTSERYYFYAEAMLLRGFTDVGSGMTGYYENSLKEKEGIEPFYLFSYGIRLGLAFRMY